MELELSTFDLPSAISNAMTLIRERAQRHDIRLGMDVDPRLGEIVADERKLKQILLNLLSNAVKFTPDGGRIDVRAQSARGRDRDLRADTGVGIAPADQEAVFEEFRQVGRHYTSKQEGHRARAALTRGSSSCTAVHSRRKRAGKGLDVHLHAAEFPMSSVGGG